MMAVSGPSLTELKEQVDFLKKKLVDPDSKLSELLLEIESLKDSVHELNVVFQKAIELTKGEDGLKSVNELKKKVEEVVNQNETIAKGMVAISDKLDDFMQKNSGRPMNILRPGAPVVHSMGMPPPSMSSPARTAPRPIIPPMTLEVPADDEDLPPPPPPLSGMAGRKKSGLFP